MIRHLQVYQFVHDDGFAEGAILAKRSVLKVTTPPGEHEAHFCVIRCTWMRAGFTPIFVSPGPRTVLELLGALPAVLRAPPRAEASACSSSPHSENPLDDLTGAAGLLQVGRSSLYSSAVSSRCSSAFWRIVGGSAPNASCMPGATDDADLLIKPAAPQDPVDREGLDVEAPLLHLPAGGVVLLDGFCKFPQRFDCVELAVLEELQDVRGSLANRDEVRLPLFLVLHRLSTTLRAG